ncbi:MAG: TrmH family RNA methyltransferase [Parachlamydiales bacterium]
MIAMLLTEAIAKLPLLFKLFFMIARDVSSLQHPIVKHLVKLRDDRKYRTSARTALISGIKLVSELSSSHVFKTVLITQGYSPPVTIKAEQTLIVTEEIMKKVTSLQNPEPLAAEIPLPAPSELTGCHPLLILDQITDPGNLGNLLRTALALGWEGAFLTPGTTDPFNDKALRAAKGATFKLKLRQGSYEELFGLVRDSGLTLLIADAKGSPAHSAPWQQPIALVLGNEAHGVQADLKNNGTAIAIPMKREMESLNVSAAGAILMFQLQGGFHGKR